MITASVTFTGPRHYNDCLGRVWFDAFAADLVQRLPQRPPGDVLEIACGTGLVTRRLRERLDPSRHLVATDLSPAMLDYAASSLGALAGIEWRGADAQALPFEDGRFGAVVCGFGFMFMPDRAAAFREARRVLANGGLLLFNVWDGIEHNRHALAVAEVLEAMFPGDPEMRFRAPWEMNDTGELRRLLAGARFRESRIETKRIAIAGADPLGIATGQIRGTPRSVLIERRGVALDLVIDKVAQALRALGGDPYAGSAQAIIVEAVATA